MTVAPNLTMTLVIGIPAGKATLILHVLSACLCGVLHWTAPRAGDAGQVGSGGGVPHKGHTNPAFSPALGETTPQPWCRPKLAKALAVSLDELDAMLAEGQTVEDGRSTSSSEPAAGGQLLELDAAAELPDDPEHDAVLVSPWTHRGTVEAAVVLRGGGRVKRRPFGFLTGMALTAPAHQWLVHEPGPLVSGLSGRRVSGKLADRLPPMIAELRAIDDVAGGGTVLFLAQHEFGWVAGLLDAASYDERTAASSTLPSPNSDSCVVGAGMTPGRQGWRNGITSPPCAPHTPPVTGRRVSTS